MKIYGVNDKKKEISNEKKVKKGRICITVILIMIITLIILKPHNEKKIDPNITIREHMDAVLDSLLCTQSTKNGYVLPVRVIDKQDIENIKIWPPCPLEEEKNKTKLKIRNLEILNAIEKTNKNKKEINILYKQLDSIDEKITTWKINPHNMLNYYTRRIQFTDAEGKNYVCFQNIDKLTKKTSLSYLYNILENTKETEGQKLLDEITKNQ